MTWIQYLRQTSQANVMAWWNNEDLRLVRVNVGGNWLHGVSSGDAMQLLDGSVHVPIRYDFNGRKYIKYCALRNVKPLTLPEGVTD